MFIENLSARDIETRIKFKFFPNICIIFHTRKLKFGWPTSNIDTIIFILLIMFINNEWSGQLKDHRDQCFKEKLLFGAKYHYRGGFRYHGLFQTEFLPIKNIRHNFFRSYRPQQTHWKKLQMIVWCIVKRIFHVAIGWNSFKNKISLEYKTYSLGAVLEHWKNVGKRDILKQEERIDFHLFIRK